MSIKTALLIVFMMVILYGAYVILYTPDPPPLQGISDLLEQEVNPPANRVQAGSATESTGGESPLVLTLDSNSTGDNLPEAPTGITDPVDPEATSLLISDDVNVTSPENLVPSTEEKPYVVPAGAGGLPVNPMEEVIRVEEETGPVIGEQPASLANEEADEAFRQRGQYPSRGRRQPSPHTWGNSSRRAATGHA